MKLKPSLSMLPAAIIVGVMYVFWLAGDGSYRYPCQDPANFGKSECLPPACLADESCTFLLIDIGE